MAEQTKEFVNLPSFSVHRANKDKNGAASRFQLAKRDNKYMLFLDVAKQNGELDQNGNATFAWRRWDKDNKQWENEDKAVVVKLGQADIGEMLAVISGRKDAVASGKGLYHENEKGNSSIDFKTYGKANEAPTTFLLTVTSKKQDAKEALRISHSLSFGEAEVLRVFLQQALLAIGDGKGTSW